MSVEGESVRQNVREGGKERAQEGECLSTAHRGQGLVKGWSKAGEGLVKGWSSECWWASAGPGRARRQGWGSVRDRSAENKAEIGGGGGWLP